jgi:tetratricopeptide (TPR) repeat protein
MREPWVELADACYRRGNWEECYGAATSALKITHKALNYTVRPESWGYKPHDLAAISAFRLGLMDKAREHGSKALEFEPTNERLLKNMEYYNGGN